MEETLSQATDSESPNCHQVAKEWSIGCCNPTGIAEKEGVLNDLPAGIWGICETHLTCEGRRKFAIGLKHVRSPFTYQIHGQAAPRRPHSDHAGAWTGVAVISNMPSRSIPARWSPQVWETARVVTATTLVHDVWVNGVEVYGYPAGVNHPDALNQAIALLQDASDRIVHQMTGPRYSQGISITFKINWQFLLNGPTTGS